MRRHYINLMDHQKRASRFAFDRPYCILAMAPRTGKTYTALHTWNRSGGERLVIVCPAYLMLNWEKEIRKFFGKRVKVHVVKGHKYIKPITKEQIVILSYDMVKKSEIYFEWASMVVADEAHALAGMESVRTQYFHRYIFENSIPRVILLSGTPIKNRVKEFYSLLSIMNYQPPIPPSLFLRDFPNQISFADEFSHRSEYQIPLWRDGVLRYQTIYKWTGIKNEEKLKGYLYPFYYRLKADRYLRIDEREDIEILVSDILDGKLLQEFKYFFDPDTKQGKSIMSSYKAEAALKKTSTTIQYVKNLLEGGTNKVVVFTDHVASCVAISKAFEVEPITGQMPYKRRFEIESEFREGKLSVLVATIASMSVGKDLSVAHDMVFNDYPWVPGDLEQAKCRIKNVEKRQKCNYHYILGSPQDAHILGVIKDKSETIRKIVD